MIAQAAAGIDPLTGGAGWASAGLFGMVLAWLLMIHLPAKDKQITTLVDNFIARGKEERADFKAALAVVTDHCDRNSERERVTVMKMLDILQIALETARQIAIVQQNTKGAKP